MFEVPAGFTVWFGGQCPIVSYTKVLIWMGGDDIIGPVRADEVDWDHDVDPVRGFAICH
jgi:hypothetical protein